MKQPTAAKTSVDDLYEATNEEICAYIEKLKKELVSANSKAAYYKSQCQHLKRRLELFESGAFNRGERS